MNDHEPDGTSAAPAPDATSRPTVGGDARPSAGGDSPARPRGQATLAPHIAFMMRLQHLDGIGAHDEAFDLALDAVRAEDKLIAKAEARRAELLAFIHEATLASAREEFPGSDDAVVTAMRERTAELALATSRSEPVVSRELGESLMLRDAFPDTEGMLRDGHLSLAHVRVILAEGRRLPDDDARKAYERAVVHGASRETPARLRARARRAAQTLMRESLDERHKIAREQRGVRVVHEDDGMSRLEAHIPTLLGAAMLDRLTEQAKALTGPDEPRTHDQIRADLLCELVLTSDPADGCGSPHGAAGGINARVAITVPVLSLLDGGDDPALLDGVVPVPVEQARELASRAPSFLRVLTDPITGVARESDTRFPTTAQREFLRVRDGHCRFPGCTRPARRCDIDHTIAVTDGGTSSLGNMAHLCRRHHTFKHATRWRVEQQEPGRLVWFSPNGDRYSDRPVPIGPRFRPSWAYHHDDEHDHPPDEDGHPPDGGNHPARPAGLVRALDTSEHSIAPTIRPVTERPRTSMEAEFEFDPELETSPCPESVDARPSAHGRLGTYRPRRSRARTDAGADGGNDPPPF
ncbi:HNH endonuclease signature motif containing protein [Pseudoclavibacter chungangensis]|uniref:HNH endonuclease signature motif containing protein n=1 Tax=Pseudoclavibacter chungangensis TaxID=587635 RepID=UPI003631FA38